MLSLCLTNYNRYEMLLESFQHVYDDERISEIVISDDASDWKIYSKLEAYCRNKTKIKLFRNQNNLGMSLNKKKAIELATNKWCILFDSDNVLRPDYLDALEETGGVQNGAGLDTTTIYAPDWAQPNFDYRAFAGIDISSRNIKLLIKRPLFDCLLNTCNYVVYREMYLAVYEHNPSVKASDTIYFNYLWLKKGGSIFVVHGMRYSHLQHPQSGFLADVNYNMQQAEKTKRMIMQL